VCVLVLGGAALGVGGGVWLGGKFTHVYQQFFHFPLLEYQLAPRVMIRAIAAGLLAAVIGALSAVRAVMRLPPAEAMRPEPPASYRRTIVDRIELGWLFGQSARMIVREIERKPLRLFLSALGVSMAVAVLVSGRFNVDAIDWFMAVQFELSQREDMTVAFRRDVPERAVRELAHLPGVRRAEGQRSVSVRLRGGHHARETALLGYTPGAELRRVLDKTGHAAVIPERGVLLSRTLAELLELRVGDPVAVEVLEGNRGHHRLQITGLVDDVYGLFGYMQVGALDQLLGDEGRVTLALLSVDPRSQGALQRALAARPEVLGVTRREAVVDMFRKQTAAQMRFTTLIMTLFAVVIASGVIYNNARIALSTRSRDLASLRVLGFRRREVSGILLGELALQVLLALLPGMFLGRMIAETMMANADPEVYRFPVVISLRTYAFAALVTLLASLVSALVVRNRIDRLDLIGVLKSRE
jgi:putative ABC transport system permease protein